MLNRVDRRSQLKCLQSCIEMLSHGASVLFFPEGTRSKDKVLGGFKKGAFSVAVKAGVPVVPITLVGTGVSVFGGGGGEGACLLPCRCVQRRLSALWRCFLGGEGPPAQLLLVCSATHVCSATTPAHHPPPPTCCR